MNQINPTNELDTVVEIITILKEGKIAYCIDGDYALYLQGVEIAQPNKVQFLLQWDVFSKAYETFSASYQCTKIEECGEYDMFSFFINGMTVVMTCYFNTVVEADHYRMVIEVNGSDMAVKSLDYYLSMQSISEKKHEAIKQHLQKMQSENSSLNEEAWNTEAYQAWINRFGTPEEAAEQIVKNPKQKIKAVYKHLGDLQGKKVINLLGSHGAKAISMALLGAEATVVDISKENEKYAIEVAEAANVPLRYVTADVLHLPEKIFETKYDIVLMELGVLHYFVDLEPLFEVMKKLLAIGGRIVIQDFHPISTKLITSKGKKHKVTGNYFDKQVEARSVAFSKHLDGSSKTSTVYLRKWTLGEIVTAIAKTGLFITELEEEPNTKLSDMGLPKTFTVVAKRID